MKKILLASSSPRRKQLLKQIGVPFQVIQVSYEERPNPRLKPKGLVESLSLGKAEAALTAYTGEPALIIGADTVVAYKDDILTKPKNEEDALVMLQRLSGNIHQVVTGFTVIDTQTRRSVTKSSVTTIYMRKLSRREMTSYVATKEPFDRAGGYGIDGFGAQFVEKIEGDYYTVVGLPLSMLVEELKRFGVTI